MADIVCFDMVRVSIFDSSSVNTCYRVVQFLSYFIELYLVHTDVTPSVLRCAHRILQTIFLMANIVFLNWYDLGLFCEYL